MCVKGTLGKVLDPLGIQNKTHKFIDQKVRDPLYKKLGIQGMQIRDPFAEAAGASKNLPTTDKEKKATKEASAAAARANGTTSMNGLVIGQRYT